MGLSIISKPQDQTVFIGGEITLSCEVDKDGVSATWKKDGKLLSDNEMITISRKDKIFTLTINKAQPSDAGVYSVHCVKEGLIRNSTAQSSAKVTVKKELQQEWRTIGSNFRRSREDPRVKKLLEELCSIKPKETPLRILLHGPPGAGKSSFVSSIDSIFKGFISSGALADGIGETSFTKRYKTYRFQHGDHWMPFVICDMMGLEQKGEVDIEDMNNILKGHVKDNYKFHPKSSLSDQDRDYNRNPDLMDKVHCLVSVVTAHNVCIMEEGTFKKMRTIRETASDMGIPQVVLMTMVDKACPIVKNDLMKIYNSARIKQEMEEYHCQLGIPVSFIFPVKNYCEEKSLNPEVDCILLDALNNIITLANDYVNTLLSSSAE